MNLDFSKIVPSIPFILSGIGVTMEYMLLSALFGLIWGVILSLFKISNNKALNGFAMVYTSIFRGTPLIVMLALIHYATPQLTGYRIEAIQSGVITFALNSAAYISETIRGGIMSVDKGQREAAMALGIPYRKAMWDIILPQAIKNILPAMVNEGIALLKDTALISTIGALDLLRRGNLVAAEKYIYFEPLLFVAVIYYTMVMILTGGAKVLERRLRRSD
ncbi:amino acid ABC transporter permease [Tumebacillus sp. ITR2]|uniref:Amino acid ABC transporter permease n=1 Tax=Tumebacillus amylolyticus TaxID=2801339 RepID=A0ABS1J881_9BACL|nr:amino acid ABC transporter permease [Tumebacillus amylolyticus]MBL0386459.1 amino acid ABC transporter permease [Tumebacillus amylolyticus]